MWNMLPSALAALRSLGDNLRVRHISGWLAALAAWNAVALSVALRRIFAAFIAPTAVLIALRRAVRSLVYPPALVADRGALGWVRVVVASRLAATRAGNVCRLHLSRSSQRLGLG